jgi:hypothetical protein
MKQTDNPKNPSKAEAKEQAGEAAAQAGEAKAASLEVVKPLTAQEKQQLARLEKVIDAKLGDFFDVGNAIMEIKTKELYRETHKNFNIYCQERFGFGRSYANKLVGSAERIKLLPENVARPANEFQVRPFLKLEPEEFRDKWPEIVKTAGEGKVTSKIVKDSLGLGRKKRKRRKAQGSDQKREVNELLVSLRAALEKKEVEDALKHLAKLEKLLKGRTN